MVLSPSVRPLCPRHHQMRFGALGRWVWTPPRGLQCRLHRLRMLLLLLRHRQRPQTRKRQCTPQRNRNRKLNRKLDRNRNRNRNLKRPSNRNRSLMPVPKRASWPWRPAVRSRASALIA